MTPQQIARLNNFLEFLRINSLGGTGVSTQSQSLEAVSSIDLQTDVIGRQGVAHSYTVTTDGTADITLSLYDSNTGSLISTVSGASGTFTSSTLHQEIDIKVTAVGLNTLTRYYRRAVTILQPTFSSGTADLVINLTQLSSGTWSTSFPDLTITNQGSNTILNFGSADNSGKKILLSGTMNGRFRIDNLRGTLANPVHVYADSTVTFNATNGSLPYCIHVYDGNQYVDFDGDNAQNIKLFGHVTSASSGQMFFIQNHNNKGILVAGIDADGQRGTGIATSGGAAIQWQTTYSATNNASNWDGEYFIALNCNVENNFGEGFYIGYFADAQIAGLRPFRIDNVRIHHNTVTNSNRDGIQAASIDLLEIHDNTITDVGNEASSSHNSGISYNDGNNESYIYRNIVTDADNFTSGQSGETGVGPVYYFNNLGVQRSSPLSGTMNQFVYLQTETLDMNWFVFNNTFDCRAVFYGPFAIEYQGSAVSLLLTFKGNVMITSGTDQNPWDELRTVNTASTDRTGWDIDNVFRRVADEAQLLLDVNYNPQSGSPALGAGFDWSTKFSGLPQWMLNMENTDINGYETTNAGAYK